MCKRYYIYSFIFFQRIKICDKISSPNVIEDYGFYTNEGSGS